jgi:peptidoglycan biosynthesis protein MviN/MurJ (putative lipid II flippase)
MLFLTRTVMDDPDNNVLVLTIFAGSLVAVIVGYLLAWRAKRTAYRTTGSLMVAVVVGFAGLCMLAWLMGAIMPLPPPDGGPIWEPLVFFLVFSWLPLGALYISVTFFRRALRDERNIQKSP